MTRRRWHSFPVLTALLLAALPICSAQAAQKSHSFRLFDAMLFSGGPDFSKYGFDRLRVVDDHELYKPGANEDEPPVMAEIQKIVAGGTGPGGIIVVDIENWPMTGAAPAVAASRRKYIETLDRFHKVAPKMKVGLYSVLPERDYWRAIGAMGNAAHAEWVGDNAAAAPISSHVDALFPSLYTFYPMKAEWVEYARANLREARRLAKGKPVYCFLWPQYHDSSALGFQLLPADYWRIELDTCRKFADGIVIWGGYNMAGGNFHPLPWDDNAPWWQTTLDFMKTLHR